MGCIIFCYAVNFTFNYEGNYSTEKGSREGSAQKSLKLSKHQELMMLMLTVRLLIDWTHKLFPASGRMLKKSGFLLSMKSRLRISGFLRILAR